MFSLLPLPSLSDRVSYVPYAVSPSLLQDRVYVCTSLSCLNVTFLNDDYCLQCMSERMLTLERYNLYFPSILKYYSSGFYTVRTGTYCIFK